MEVLSAIAGKTYSKDRDHARAREYRIERLFSQIARQKSDNVACT